MKRLRYNSGLDGIRFFAVSAVMMAHWSEQISVFNFLTPYASYLAYSGVGLFFVLSGFLITGILLNSIGEKGALWKFYSRRFLRIFPLYYLVLFVCLAAKLPYIHETFPWLVSYSANYYAAFHPEQMGQLAHFWSLCVEEQFYLLLPLIILFVARRFHKRIFIGLIAIAVASRLATYYIFPQSISAWGTYIFTPSCFDCFGLGALLAYYYLYNRKRLFSLLKYKMYFILTGVLSIVLYYLAEKGEMIILPVMFLRLMVALFCFWIIGLIALRASVPLVTNKIVVYLGQISYGLYVYHNLMPLIFEHINVPHKAYLYPVATVALSALSFHLYEHPINKLKERFR